MYTYAIEYFDSDSVLVQFTTLQADCIEQAVKYFKQDKPVSKIYDIFVRHNQADDFYEEDITV